LCTDEAALLQADAPCSCSVNNVLAMKSLVAIVVNYSKHWIQNTSH